MCLCNLFMSCKFNFNSYSVKSAGKERGMSPGPPARVRVILVGLPRALSNQFLVLC